MISPVKIQENINGALQDLVTVSDIVDYGSNSNGYYVKFSNGLVIMSSYRSWMSLSSSTGMAYINGLYQYTALFTYPTTLTAIISSTVDLENNDNVTGFGQTYDYGIRSGSAAYFCSLGTLTNARAIGNFVIIGLWK